jgi:hypothetical protein
MILPMKTLLVSAMVVAVLAVLACGGKLESEALQVEDGAARAVGAPAQAMMEALAAPAMSVPAAMPAPAAPPARPAAPAPAAPSLAAALAFPAAAAAPSAEEFSGVFDVLAFSEEDVASLVVLQRIIVRTVDMSIVVTDVAAAVDAVAGLAGDLGGWMVSTNRSEKHIGFVSVRVPADRLDEAVMRLRNMAVEVESEVSSSRDVTDEYFDTKARLVNLQATEQALLKLLDRAEKVEDALEVQQAVTQVQEDIERHLGRIKLLEETSRFSLINVRLELESAEMSVDAGADQTSGVGVVVRFRAFFNPPEEIEDFTFTWDFGDGTPPITSDRTAPTEEEGTRVTATVTHQYFDERDSPFFAEVQIKGFGDAGLAEGEDILTVTVTRIPIIEVFAGDDIAVEEGEEVEFSGSFTRPEGVTDVEFRWAFGDGSTPESGSLQQGVTFAVARHVYPNDRPLPYTATLTIVGQSDAGEIEASSSIRVRVREAEVFAGDDMTVEEGEEVEFSGSFTRPEGVTDVKFRWAFGDGSPPETGSLKEGVTNAVARHVYPNSRPRPYTATLTITAESDAGRVESSGSLQVRVEESKGWVNAGWDVAERVKTGVRALSGVGQALGTGLIWVAIFSPVWAVVGVVGVVLWRRIRGRRRDE